MQQVIRFSRLDKTHSRYPIRFAANWIAAFRSDSEFGSEKFMESKKTAYADLLAGETVETDRAIYFLKPR